jgi:small subunit ribosomal protein S8
LAKILEREGYIGGFETKANEGRPGSSLTIELKYDADRRSTIAGLKRVSKPGLRIYAQADNIQRVLGGFGVSILSTSAGLMTDREARKRHLGGEVVCHVW